MIRGNTMACYKATMHDGSVSFLSAFSMEQARGLFHYHFPEASISSIVPLSDGFDDASPPSPGLHQHPTNAAA